MVSGAHYANTPANGTVPVDSKSVNETASAGEFLVDSLLSSDGLLCPDWLRRQPLKFCATFSMPRSARAPACLLDGGRQISWDRREAHKDEICPKAAQARGGCRYACLRISHPCFGVSRINCLQARLNNRCMCSILIWQSL